MSSSPPAPGKEDEEVRAETVDGEAPSPLQAAEAAVTGVLDGAAAANRTTLFGREEVNLGNDQQEDMDNSDGDDGEEEDFDDDMVDYDLDESEFGSDEVEFGSGEEGGPVFLPRAEFEATMEALWRKVAGVEEKPSAGNTNTCLVCMEPLTCEGHHRICCIPCGHVYGRSCLEKWLHSAGKESAKCPQCKLQFEDKLIINLYTPANLGDGCGTIQEVKVYVSKALDDVFEQCKYKYQSKTTTQLTALQDVVDQIQNVLLTRMISLKEELATASASLMSMKDGIKKMAEEEGVMPKDLVEFVEKNCPQLPSLTVPEPPTPADS
ncbi:hypothetical protein ACQJBY_034867 [Aegilops geniculata]